MARQTRDDEERSSGRQRAGQGEKLGDRPLPALRSIEPDRDGGRAGEEQNAELEIEEGGERGGADERHERGDVEDRTQRELRRREEDVDRRRDRRDCGRDGEADRERGAWCPEHGERPGARSASEDVEADRGHHREEGDPAGGQQTRCCRCLRDRRDDELGRRAGVGADRERAGAADRVAVDGDDPPVDEVPAPHERSSGTTSVSGSAADRLCGAAARCLPLASVTETIAKRGSTASL
jgi:hypothetical protein